MLHTELSEVTGSYRIHVKADLARSATLDWPYLCGMSLLKYPVNDAISEQLALMGNASNADRAWMIEYRPDLLRFCNTHEWCRGQTKAYISELQETPTTLIAWLHKYLMLGHAVAVHDVTDLPRTARAIQVEFLRQSNKSVLSVPVFYDDKLRGIIGFDTTVANKIWSASEVNALFQCANLIGQAKYSTNRAPEKSIAAESTAPLVYLSNRGVVRGVQPEIIVGVRSAGNYSEIWLEDGSMLLDSRSLGMWSSLLPSKIFLRIHRTAFVNTLHVVDVDRRKIDKWQIRMRAVDQAWPVSRSYRRQLRERMGI
ncbi:LytTR family transcriptional regulator DNA-binding domain-containing protein [Ochrobactrum teleogrylli]